MRELVVEVFSEAVNGPVIRIPGRKFPGLLVQGDTLKCLLDSVAVVASSNPSSEEAGDELAHVLGQFGSMLEVYEQTLISNQLELPYKK